MRLEILEARRAMYMLSSQHLHTVSKNIPIQLLVTTILSSITKKLREISLSERQRIWNLLALIQLVSLLKSLIGPTIQRVHKLK